MKKITLKEKAKINLNIDVLSSSGGFHQIESLVASIDLFDKVTVKARKDDKIVIKERGLPCGCEEKKNNAYKTAQAFMEKFETSGVTIIIDKNIPVAGGLGGSSADISAVLKGMRALYKKDADVLPLAKRLGSDVTYMLNGGYALLKGKGDEVTNLRIDKEFDLILITNDKGVSAKECYKTFDDLNVKTKKSSGKCVTALMNKDYKAFYKIAKNDLYISAKTILKELCKTEQDLKNAGADLVLMSGSGSTMFGIFENKKVKKTAYKKLKKVYGKRVILSKTVR